MDEGGRVRGQVAAGKHWSKLQGGEKRGSMALMARGVIAPERGRDLRARVGALISGTALRRRSLMRQA